MDQVTDIPWKQLFLASPFMKSYEHHSQQDVILCISLFEQLVPDGQVL